MAGRFNWPRRRRKDAEHLRAQVRNLRESRRQIVEAFEIERHRIERDLHDGSQQYLVATGLKLGELQYLLAAGQGEDAALEISQIRDLVEQALSTNQQALTSLQRTVAGVHPRQLEDLGLEKTVRQMAAEFGSHIRVRVPHPLPQIPLGVATTAYYLVAEALTNVGKYAPDAPTSVLLSADSSLRVSIVDQGPGGVQPRPGGGLAGLTMRLNAFGGSLTVTSPVGGPTSIQGVMPLLLREGEAGLVVEEDM